VFGCTSAGYAAGITSYGDANCTKYGVSTRVDAYEDLISDFVCDAGESCDGRGPTSECAADCDGVLSGMFLDRYCYVGPICIGPGCS